MSETKKGMFKGKKNPSARKIKHTPTGKVFECCKDAAKWQGINYKTFMNRIYNNANCNEFEYIK